MQNRKEIRTSHRAAHCSDALTADKHTIVFDFTYRGPSVAKGGTGVLKVDGKEVAKHTQPNSIVFWKRRTRASTLESTPALG